MLLRALTFLMAVFPAGNLPFSVDASENAAADFPGAPPIQSFSFAQWQGRWVFIGGRIAGYHSVGGGTAEFLKADANRDVWVVDTTVKPAKTYHVPVENLPATLAPVKEQWDSTGQVYNQDGRKLYIAGGYGQDRAGDWTTFPLISQVDLPLLIDGVMHGRLPPASIAYAQTPLGQSSGGELIKLPDGFFYLVMGHVFQGSYTAFEGHGEHNTKSVSQTYLSEIRKLRIVNKRPGELAVTLVDTFRDPAEFHRRDMNVASTLSAAGLGLAVYGGVFTPETQLAYTKPVYLNPNSRPVIDRNFDQKMNAYTCPKLLMYDQAAETMYTTFFGGISRHSWDAATQQFIENPKVGTKAEPAYLDGLQWSDQISTIRRVMASGREETSEMVHQNPLPAFLGTGGVFIAAPEIARAWPDTQILDLQSMRGKRTFVGYIYGGIQASPYRFPYLKTAQPYNAGTVPTKSSEYILRVFLRASGTQARP
jgi:hypothetical protein